MKAFHSDPKIKKKYLARVTAHEKADEIIKGVYWEKGKGCAVGCTIHSSNHASYETELGIPRWLARLEDKIFEGMSPDKAKKWPREFLKAIKSGADLSKALIPMLIVIVESAKKNARTDKSKTACDGVLIELRRDVLDLDKLRTARSAAAAAAAAAAAYAAADDAAAYAADAAAYAADAAAYAADAAAAADARLNCYDNFGDELLKILKECK